jgi:hypothetical protein
MKSPLADGVLEGLRTVGDPELEALTELGRLSKADLLEFMTAVQNHGLHSVAPSLLERFPEMTKIVDTQTITRDPSMLRDAQVLFGTFGTEISGALLLAALPQSYATERGSVVLIANDQLRSNLVRRIRGTALFLLIAMQRTPPTRAGRQDDATTQQWVSDPPPKQTEDLPQTRGVLSWQICAALRVYHHAIRTHLRDVAPDVGVAVNQEDLLGMLLTFTISVFEVLERYGICWTAEQQEAYLHAWDVIGDQLGIGTPAVKAEIKGLAKSTVGWHGLRPPTVIGTRDLLEQIRERHWLEPSVTSAHDEGPGSGMRSGRLLTSSLLDELAAAMPSTLKMLPITVMRILAPDVVRRRLALGHSGILIRALGQMPKRRKVVGRFTAISTPNPIVGRVLRRMANEVTSRAALRFLEGTDYFIPGLEDWSRELQGFR